MTGIELNKSRLKVANKGLENTCFLVGNVLKERLPRTDAVTMIHLLHHLPSRKSQEELIERVSSNLKIGGKLIIAEVSEKPFFKYLLSWVVDMFVVPVLFEGKLFSRKINYRKDMEWRKLLLDYGFKVQFRSLHKGKPFSHSLFIATKI